MRNCCNEMCQNSIYDIPYTKEQHEKNKELYEMVLYKALAKVKVRSKDIVSLIRIGAEIISENIECGVDDTSSVYNLIFDCIMFFDEHKRKNVVQELIKLYNNRNHDYGNIAEKQLMWDGAISYKVMLEHKVSRFLNLLEKDNKSKNDSIEDTVKDIVGYSVIYLMWIIKGKKSIKH